MAQAPNPTPQRAITALLGLTFVTGLIDAASVLGLGHVFVANMTGNVVFIGFGLLGQGNISLPGALLALFGFLCGAGGGGRLARGTSARGLRVGFTLDVALLALGAGSVWLTQSPLPTLLLLAAAVGLRTALVRSLAIPDIPTTVLTLTITGIAADSSIAGGTNVRLGRRVASILAMLVGASLGALLHARAGAAILPTVTGLEALAALLLLSGLPSSPREPHA
ncbi:MAG: YoaK family protein [Polyangiaceae bacterium]